MKKKVLKVIGFLIVTILLAGVSVFVYASLSLPDIDGYEYTPSLKTDIYSTDNKLVAEVYDENRTLVSYDEMPEDLVHAIVSVEDRRFYKHNGFDIQGILRAMAANLKGGGIHQGASTLTQQVVRRLFLSDEQTYTRKIKEILLSIKFEKQFSKKQILEIYLNDVFMGENTYGAEEASKRYFGKHVKDLNVAECALIAGLPQAPTVYNPTSDKGYKKCMQRQREVLEDMKDCGYLTDKQYKKALNTKISISKDQYRKNFNGRTRKGCGAYTQQVLSETKKVLKEKFTNKNQMSEKSAENKIQQMINQDGLKITCSMDVELQKAAYKNVKPFLSAYGQSKSGDLAYVSVDATSGRVLAYYGGKSSIDMANTPRQPGSTIKPLYVSKYLEKSDITEYSSIMDGQINIYGYSPKNYGDKYYGMTTVKNCITHSLNTGCLRVYQALGTGSDGLLNGYKAVKDFGFTTLDDERDNNYAFALGGLTHGFKPLELANAYSSFANDGEMYKYYFVEKVTTRDGKVLYERKPTSAKKVRSSRANDAIVDCMKSVVTSGTGVAARTGYETFGKTGTTNDNKDFWFSGVTGNVATSVWVGNADNRVLYGIYSSNVAGFYARYIYSASKTSNFSELFNVNQYSSSSEQNQVYEKILVVNDDVNTDGRDYFTRLEVSEKKVKEQDVKKYASRIVTAQTVDSSTGLLFNKNKCKQKNKEVRYYLSGEEPTKKCNKSHFFN